MFKTWSKTIVSIIVLTLFLAAFTVVTAEEIQNERMVTMDNGLSYEIVTEGTGAVAASGNTVVVHYTGTFMDGRVFDSSVERGQPFEFRLGAGMVIRGWDIGVEGMKIGEKRILNIPSALAYGERGAGGIIAPNTDLVFEVELLEIK